LAVTGRIAPLPGWLERNALTQTSPSARQALWAIGTHLSGDPDLGFRVAEALPLETLGEVLDVLRSAPTLEALHRSHAAWRGALLDFVTQEITVRDGCCRIRHQAPVPLHRAEQDFRVLATVRIWAEVAGRAHLPAAVHFAYSRPRSTATHRAWLQGCELHFGGAHLEIVLPHAAATTPLSGGDLERFDALVADLRERLDDAPKESLPERVDACITEMLAVGAGVERVAARLFVSERHLRRRLTATSTSFRQLLERARRRESDLLNALPDLSADQRAAILGFSGRGALYNAERRWARIVE